MFRKSVEITNVMEDHELIEQIMQQQKSILELDQHYKTYTMQLEQDIQDLQDEICRLSKQNSEEANNFNKTPTKNSKSFSNSQGKEKISNNSKN